MRDGSSGGGPIRQVFFRLGDPILEMVGPPEPSGDGPARFFGLALTVADLDATALKGVAGDGGVQGYGVVLSWTKPGSDEKVNESLVFWVDKAIAQGFVARRLPAADLVKRATLNYFDGIDERGRIALEVWEDNFTATFKVKDAAPHSVQTC